MPSIETAFPSRFIKHDHLEGEKILTISSAYMEELSFKDKTEKKLVVAFKEPVCEDGPYELALNKTNARAIASAVGSKDYDTWAGKRVKLFPTTDQAFGEEAEVVRIDNRAPVPGEFVDGDDVPF